MVLSLFAHALTFAWMVGHSLEKLLAYDLCTMSSLIALCYAAGNPLFPYRYEHLQ